MRQVFPTLGFPITTILGAEDPFICQGKRLPETIDFQSCNGRISKLAQNFEILNMVIQIVPFAAKLVIHFESRIQRCRPSQNRVQAQAEIVLNQDIQCTTLVARPRVGNQFTTGFASRWQSV
jgi:hypothetical protein